ncbi:hypothetical protein GLOTRDRAFT_64912 [Gloeophyllum trabeum ATCC 11539]|uniref:Uncharacterized protein n=1 Tax=Gloeophyllum trabeum (strain ATCC 11539 / FP-39264 / Madison 617) TaxID=670483 RepID=S7RD59_GLOTA|nr:uncharacterized protein GLOTRDRAFT_64912 [Gloeophyllum trabeum ATCC 11539]EPQ52145.1 hypothetical protein GLOTRDRAFT_64912 [Gloeophyllum trabeum ATCC 11539]
MPHKRAKRSVREQQLAQRGSDLAPGNISVSAEGIPKSMARVLNAAKLHAEYRKRKNEDQNEGGKKKKKRKVQGDRADKADMKILPGESLAHFNRRVEDAMRPLVREAVQASSALERKTRKEMLQEKAEKQKAKSDEVIKKQQKSEDAEPERPDKAPSPAKKTDFPTLSTSQPRRLNDIALAPPQFTKVPRLRKGEKAETTKAEGVLSMAQKQMMEAEREKAIQRYRDMKKAKLRESGKLWAEQGEVPSGS